MSRKPGMADASRGQVVPMPAAALAQVYPGVGSIQSVRDEIDATLAAMREMHRLESDQVMRAVAGLTARLVELRINIVRMEVMAPIWKNLRTQELEPTLDELGRQYAIASRLHSVRELDYRISTGAP